MAAVEEIHTMKWMNRHQEHHTATMRPLACARSTQSPSKHFQGFSMRFFKHVLLIPTIIVPLRFLKLRVYFFKYAMCSTAAAILAIQYVDDRSEKVLVGGNMQSETAMAWNS